MSGADLFVVLAVESSAYPSVDMDRIACTQLALCTRVCSTWYLAFGAALYKDLSFNSQRTLAHFGSTHGQRGLSRNAECVHFIRSEFCYVFQALPEVPFCNLRLLSTLASEYPNKGIVDVTNARRILKFVSLNQSLQEICLRNFPWMCETTALQLKETLQAHPRLKIVSLSSFREVSLGNLIHVLRGITNLEKLSLVCRSAISWEEGSALAGVLADNATEFSLLDAGTVCQLKELEISADLSQIAQVILFPLLRHCQRLGRLHIPNVDIDNGPQFNELCRLVNVCCPQLKHLASDHRRGTDVSQASLLESCCNLRSYKQLQPQPFGSLSVSALLSLDRHSTTLESLDISQCFGIDSKDLQLILTSCPNLQVFEALPSTNSSFRFEARLNVQDMFTPARVTSESTTPAAKSSVAASRPGQWACHRLRVIKLGFSGFSEFATTQEVAPYTDAVYHQLSLLTELEELHLAGEYMIAPSIFEQMRRGGWWSIGHDLYGSMVQLAERYLLQDQQWHQAMVLFSRRLRPAYITRGYWLPKLEDLRERLNYTQLPFFRSEEDSSFAQNIEEGLTSSNFDLHQNLLGGDERHGLENAEEIRKIMKKYRCNFDQARLIQQQNKMKANGIDPRTGVPIDPKAVYFS
ncbi:hypothetical protein BGZ74_005404 [Mortierella antarctica]|nr:hypothetical protein BGZ74_005404 [Mortierella antarctica]